MREHDLKQQLGNHTSERASDALQWRPAEEVERYDKRKDEIVHKLSDRSRNVGAQRKSKEVVLLVFESLTYAPIDKVVDKSRRNKRNRTAQKHVPSAAERVVESRIDDALAAFHV